MERDLAIRSRLERTGSLQIGWRIWRQDHWPSRLEAVRVLLTVGLLVGVLMSWKLWMTDRAFPHLPVFTWFGPFPEPWDQVLYGAFVLALVGSLLRPGCRWALGSVLGIAVLLALQDQVRWQPWFYLYLLGLVAYLYLPGRAWLGAGSAVLGLVRLLLVAMYFWSGYHKLHPAFDVMFPQAFLDPLTGVWPAWGVDLLRALQPTIPWVEMGAAFLLLSLVPVVRHAGVLLAVSTHLFIFLLIGPLGMNDNIIIWPWNLCMALVVPLAFWGNPSFGWREMVVTPIRFWLGPFLVLLAVMPAFSPGIWDRYLSFHLYSGRDQRVMLVLDEKAAQVLPEEVRAYLKPGAGGRLQELRFKQWALEELRVPFPTEERLNLRLAKHFAALPYPRGRVVFFYYDYEFEQEERGWDKFTPGQMLLLEKLPDPTRTFVAP